MGDVVEEGLDEDLETGHGCKWEPSAGDEDADGVAEVGGGYHFDVFDARKNVSIVIVIRDRKEKLTCFLE